MHSCSVDVTTFAAQTFGGLSKQNYVAAALWLLSQTLARTTFQS